MSDQTPEDRLMALARAWAEARGKLDAYCGISTPLRREHDRAKAAFTAALSDLSARLAAAEKLIADAQPYRKKMEAMLAAAEARELALREALEPFAKAAEAFKGYADNTIITNDKLGRSAELPNYYLTMRDLRRAATAISAATDGRK